MTQFHEVPGKDFYKMETFVSDDAMDLIDNIHSVEAITPTDAYNRVIGMHALYTEVVDQGNLIVSRTEDKITALSVPESSNEFINGSLLTVNIIPKAYRHVSKLANPDDRYDLISFWRSAAKLYSNCSERQMLGEDLLVLHPELYAERIRLQSSILEEYKPQQRTWRRIFNKLLDH